MANKSLSAAKSAKKDEFYTQSKDVENELRHYKDQFKDKVVFCNCDDPFESNFFKYFAANFEELGLKKLIATSYVGSPVIGLQLALPGMDKGESEPVSKLSRSAKKGLKHGWKIVIHEVPDMDKNGAIDILDVKMLIQNTKNTLTPLKGNGDFRSNECIALLKEADIVCTNPPFSLFREYVAQLIRYKKNFVIIGSMHSLHYKEIFELIKSNKMWLGHKPTGTDMLFNVPVDFAAELVKTKKKGSGYRIIDGIIMGRAAAIWFTNLDVTKRHEPLTLYKKYSPKEYIKYDNFDAIEVNKVAHIPKDYDGLIGVPDAFLDKYNPDQFELIGIPTGNSGKELGVKKNYRGRTDISITRNGKISCPYSRIIIRRKVNI